MAAENSVAVLIASPDHLQVPAIGEGLAAFKGIPVQDALHEAKACWGIVGENLSPSDAERLVHCLDQASVKTICIEQGHLRPVPPKIELIHSTVDEMGISGTDEKHQSFQLSLNELRVISASALSSTTSKTITEKQGPSTAQKAMGIGLMLATGLPIPVGPKKKTIVKKVSETELSFYLTILTNTAPTHFRLPANGVNFSYLKERKLYNVMGNFKLLLIDIAQMAPQAKQGKGTRVMLANQILNKMGYESEADVEREACWLNSLP